MNDNNEALMRAWAKTALEKKDYDPRRDAVARFILKNIDDPYEGIEVGSVYTVNYGGEERVALRGGTRWYLCETDEAFSDVTEDVELVSELVPKSTPDHPEFLVIEADYRNAPEGTLVAAEHDAAWTKSKDGAWETFGIVSGYNNYAMADDSRRVLRWGWKA